MSQINSVGGPSPIQQIVANPIQKQIPAGAPQPMRATDKLELSGSGQLLQTLKANDIRTDKVAAIKQQIDAGTYDADGTKLDAAIDKLAEDL